MVAQLAISDTSPKDESVRTSARASEPARSKAWYLDPGLIISAAAFLASIVTSILSIQRDQTQDLVAKEDALHAAVQQHASNFTHMIEINKAWNLELTDLGFDFGKAEDAQVSGDSKLQNSIKVSQILDDLKNFNANFDLETMTLSKQAHSLVDGLGAAASAVDLSDVAVVLSDAQVQDFPEQLDQQAIAKAGSSVEFLGAERGLAKALFRDGRTDESRVAIDDALKVFERFPSETPNPDNIHRTQFQTYMWAINYVGTDDCLLVRGYLASAKNELAALKRPPGAPASLSNQVNEAEISVKSCPQASADPATK